MSSITHIVHGKKYRLTIERDDEAESPRCVNNLGYLVCAHLKHNIGDYHTRDRLRCAMAVALHEADKATKERVANMTAKDEDTLHAKLITLARKRSIVRPLYMMDHSGLTLSLEPFTGEIARWDSGQLGFAVVSLSAARKAFPELRDLRLQDKLVERCMASLKHEIDTYNKFLHGLVYRFELELWHDEDWQHVASCGEFYVEDPRVNGMRHFINKELHPLLDVWATTHL